jgi:hypothetical protein
LFVVLGLFSSTNLVLATTTQGMALEQLHAGADGAGITKESPDPRIVAAKVIKNFLGLLGAMAMFLFVYAGYLLITSHGESEKLGKASKIMTGAVIGLLLILLSFSITNFVGNKIQQSINQERTR